MKFAEALQLSRTRPPKDARPFNVALVCGCTAHHLEVFLTAHLRNLLPDREVLVQPGLYGDCLGNLERARQQPIDGVAVLLEWADLDPRLGVRGTGGWSPSKLPDILANVETQAARLLEALDGTTAPIAFCLPTLPLPPLAFTPGWLLSDFEVRLRSTLHSLAEKLVGLSNVRLVNSQRLDLLSLPGDRLDVKGELLSGSPYRMTHASAVTEMLARLLQMPPPRKGLITDLDDTLWRGILGEVGTQGISWSLDDHSHAHALYQQLLQSLADSGTLIGVASKNDPARVEEAFRRDDLLLARDRVFPVEAHWGPKSESVCRILKAWNVAADSVVFVDDTPLELEEVRAAHPGIETLLFPKDQDQAVHDLLVRLRDLFGKPAVREEDALRLDSLRVASEISGTEAADQDRFLAGVEAEIVLDTDSESPDPRALELVNKTNQFNLNGRRYSEVEWLASLRQPDAFCYLVSYRDRFGPLGKVAVLSGRREGTTLFVETWVLSCRAFSRRIEHRCLALLFEDFDVEEIVFAFEPTPRNGPLQELFTSLLGIPPAGQVRLSGKCFEKNCPPLFHRVKVVAHG